MAAAFDSVPSFDGSPDDRQEKAASHCRLGARRGAEGMIWLVASQQLVQETSRGGPASLGGDIGFLSPLQLLSHELQE